MAFKHLDDEAVRATPGFSPFLETKLAPGEFAANPSRAHQLLRIPPHLSRARPAGDAAARDIPGFRSWQSVRRALPSRS
ncbi:MAG: hypothetical protein H0X73_06240 [Chthoniobacterales bacterium]|nr:hypothetical protein [Chthoniobacterales bacterium]